MSRRQRTDAYEKAKQWLPYIISGTSLAVSFYTLHLLYRKNRSGDRDLIQRIAFPKNDVIARKRSSSNEDVCATSTLSRLMQPDDANGAGNVHGGTTLKMISHTAWLSASRYLNNHLHGDEDHKYIAVMMRCESMDFKLPIHIGEVCTCNAKVSFTSNRSIEVEVTVIAENATSARRRVTNSARLWFIGIRVSKTSILGLSAKHRPLNFSKQDLIQIPALNHSNSEEYEAGFQRYQKQKASRNKQSHLEILNAVDLNEWTDRILNRDQMDKERAGGTAFKLVQVTLPSDCFGTESTMVDGGYVMKMMDNVAGCCAFQWAKQRVVTIHINAINFHSPVDAGNVCHCYGRLVFTSKRSMEVFVLTFVHCDESENDDKAKKYVIGQHRLKLVCSAYFTFVALNADDPPKSVDVPQFTPRTAFERMVHSQAMFEYEERKKARKRKTTKSAKYKPTVVVGPSGVGKGTLLKALREHYGGRLSVAVSHTTRKPRTGEVNGVHYHFVSKEQFENDIKEGKFVEYAGNYGNLYGTSKQAVKDVADQQKICLLEIDYVGAKLIKESDIDANYLFITVDGEAESCKKRIEGRGTESAEQIEKRYQTAISEFAFFNQNKQFFDAAISNDDLENSKTEIVQLFKTWYSWL